jgi:hypothetical protein
MEGLAACFEDLADPRTGNAGRHDLVEIMVVALCTVLSGLDLLVRSHMNAGQDGFRDKSSKQHNDLIEGHWVYRSVLRRGSIDHTICSLSCKFWHRLSTVAVELLPVSG